MDSPYQKGLQSYHQAMSLILIRTHSLYNQLQSRSQVSKSSNLDRCAKKLAVVMQSGLKIRGVDSLKNWLQSCSQASLISNLDRCLKILAVVMQSGLIILLGGHSQKLIVVTLNEQKLYAEWILHIKRDCSHIIKLCH